MVRQAYKRLDNIFGTEQKILLLFLEISAILVNVWFAFWAGFCYSFRTPMCSSSTQRGTCIIRTPFWFSLL